MFITNVRRIIGIQRLLAAAGLIALFLVHPVSGDSGISSTTTLGDTVEAALRIPVLDILLVFAVLFFEGLLFVSAYSLWETGKPHKTSSGILIGSWFVMVWTVRAAVFFPIQGWFPIDFGGYQLAAWFCVWLPIELAVVEILLPSHNIRLPWRTATA